ncbi:hypothetical protein [Eggerthella lenta]|uniref:hypothetical protein n=1 Tax=Eggerthella lenta TaxID=84112 RepID=UPI0036F408E1
MREYVHGKVYDTAQSRLVGTWSNDARIEEDRLTVSMYCTRAGAYYIVGDVCADPYYIDPDGINIYARRDIDIVALTRDRAVAWAREHLAVDVAEAEFGPIPEA